MNKTELIARMAEKDAEKTLNSFVPSVQEIVKSGDKISLVGFWYHRDESVII